MESPRQGCETLRQVVSARPSPAERRASPGRRKFQGRVRLAARPSAAEVDDPHSSKLARMSIKAQVWRQSQCGAPHARRDPRPHLARRRAQANSEVIRYKRAAQRRQLMLYVLGETTTTVEETEPPKAIVIDEEEAARKKKRRAKTKAGALGRMMRLVNKARGRPDTGSMSDATSGAFGGLAQAHNPCDMSCLPGLPVVTPHVISEQHRPPTPAQPGRASMTTMAQLDPAVRQRWWT